MSLHANEPSCSRTTAAVRAGSTTVGAFAGDIPDTVTSLAFPLIHAALAADSVVV